MEAYESIECYLVQEMTRYFQNWYLF